MSTYEREESIKTDTGHEAVWWSAKEHTMRTYEREESIKTLFRRYKDMSSTAADLQDWLAFTADMSEDDLYASVIELVKTFTYPDPKVADLRATWQRILDARKDKSQAARQWKDSVERAMRREGRSWTPAFRDPITQEVIDTYGWGAMCNMDDKELEWKRREFIKDYEAIADRLDGISKLSPAAKRLTHTESRMITDGRS